MIVQTMDCLTLLTSGFEVGSFEAVEDQPGASDVSRLTYRMV